MEAPALKELDELFSTVEKVALIPEELKQNKAPIPVPPTKEEISQPANTLPVPCCNVPPFDESDVPKVSESKLVESLESEVPFLALLITLLIFDKIIVPVDPVIVVPFDPKIAELCDPVAAIETDAITPRFVPDETAQVVDAITPIPVDRLMLLD